MAVTKDRNMHGVDVIINEEILSLAPHCQHGPTLLFEKYSGDGDIKRYFACSAFRDRKLCRFYQPVLGNLDLLLKNSDHHDDEKQDQTQRLNYARFLKAKSQRQEHRKYCHTCHTLMFKEDLKLHNSHKVTGNISDWFIGHPSNLMAPQDNNRSHAQYFFSQKSTEFLMRTIKSLGFDRVLCVGVPRLHEILSEDKDELKIESLLLDIDDRYEQFFSPGQFCRYNMFNHHFFNRSGSLKTFHQFLQKNGGSGLLLVTDPPFGGLVDALVFGMTQIKNIWRKLNCNPSIELPLMWIFPYFMEKRILSTLPTLQMIDYKVDYDNHMLFKSGSKSKKSSPVRIFTNLKPAAIVLPSKEGYRFCTICQRYSSAENVHCVKCKKCTSKDGSTYRHCNSCQRCVKPTYTHCSKCGKCELSSHDCNRVLIGCHLCGDLNHKRQDCPNRPTDCFRLSGQLTCHKTSVQTTLINTAGHNDVNIKKETKMAKIHEDIEGGRCREFNSRIKKLQQNIGLQPHNKKRSKLEDYQVVPTKRRKMTLTDYVRKRKLKGFQSNFYPNFLSKDTRK